MTPYIMTLTQAGLAAIVNVQAGTIGPVSIAQIGLTDAAFTVASTLEALPGEFKRLDVAGDALGDDLIHLTALDDSTDAYGYRAFALYTSSGLLFAVYGQADRIAEKTPGTVSYMALDIAMARGQSDAISFGNTDFLNPPATTTQQGVVELATDDEAQAGTDALRAITPASAKAAVLSWIGFVPLAASAFTQSAILSLLGYVPFDSAGFTGAAVKSVLGYIPLDAAAFTKASILSLLGYTPQDAAASTFGSNANGYWEIRPNGVLEQWGQATAYDPWSGALTFPTPFADTASISIIATSRQSDNVATDGNKINAEWIDAATFKLGSDDNPKPVFWRAIGKAPA